MTHSALTTRIRLSSQSSDRNGTEVDTFLVHHQGSTNAEATAQAMISGSKEVSANYIITNEGEIWLIVDEARRAWTSGSSTDGGRGAQWDRRSITVEIENETGDPNWRISEAALRAAARLLQDLRSRYNIKYVYGHRDLYALFSASYPTYCPGPQTVYLITSMAGGGTYTQPALSTPTAVASADYGYGLNAEAQLAIQKALARLGRYKGDQDGKFGAQSVMAFQKWLVSSGFLAGDYDCDGVPGPLYGEALHDLADEHGYTGTHEGLPGGNVSAALVRWASTVAASVPQVIAVTPTTPAGPGWSYWEPSGELAKRLQRALKNRGRLSSDYVVDGVLGEVFRKAVQTTLNVSGRFVGDVDGVIEEGGCYGIQKYARDFGDYTGDVDGAPRENSWIGFALGLERP